MTDSLTGLNSTILDEVTPEMRVVREEIFGPAVALVEVDFFEDAIALPPRPEG